MGISYDEAAQVSRTKAFAFETPKNERADLLRESLLNKQVAVKASSFAKIWSFAYEQRVVGKTMLQMHEDLRTVGLIDEDVKIEDFPECLGRLLDDMLYISESLSLHWLDQTIICPL